MKMRPSKRKKSPSIGGKERGLERKREEQSREQRGDEGRRNRGDRKGKRKGESIQKDYLKRGKAFSSAG